MSGHFIKSHSRVCQWSLLLAGIIAGLFGHQVSGQGVDPVLVVTGSVCESSFSDQQTFVGSIEAIRQSVVGSAVAGRVRSVDVERGSAVKGPDLAADEAGAGAGTSTAQILAQIETGTLEIEIAGARIQKELAGLALSELKLTLPVEVRLAEARQKAADARRDNSASDAGRLSRMAGQSRMADQSSAVSVTELELSQSQAVIDGALADEAAAELDRLRSTAEVRLQQAISRVAVAEQEIMRLEDQRTKYTIRAPFDGFVVNKLTEAGAWLAVGAPVAEIVELDRVDFVFPVSQELVSRIQTSIRNSGEPFDVSSLEIRIEGLDQPFAGQLIALAPVTDLRTRQVNVRARVENTSVAASPLLRPGMIGKVRVVVGAERKVLLVSRDALVLGGAAPVVYKLNRESPSLTAVAVPVELGESLGSWIEVKGDLQAGEQVVVEGNERLRTGTPLNVSSLRPDTPAATSNSD